METIYIKGAPHYIFDNRKEFEEYFMDRDGTVPPLIENWRKAAVGDWVLADDGGVCEIIYRGKLKSGRQGWTEYVRTPIGTFNTFHKEYMDTDKSLHYNRFRFGKNTKESIKHKKSLRITSKEREFIIYILMGKTIKEAHDLVYGEHVDWKYKAMSILRRPLVMAEIRKNIKDLANDLGLTFEYILSKYKELAEGSKSEAVKLSALKEIADIIGMQDEISHGARVGGFDGFKKLKEPDDIEDAELDE